LLPSILFAFENYLPELAHTFLRSQNRLQPTQQYIEVLLRLSGSNQVFLFEIP
ncbi:unnamed protein product, partial [marine sediment metagenome]